MTLGEDHERRVVEALRRFLDDYVAHADGDRPADAQALVDALQTRFTHAHVAIVPIETDTDSR